MTSLRALDMASFFVRYERRQQATLAPEFARNTERSRRQTAYGGCGAAFTTTVTIPAQSSRP